MLKLINIILLSNVFVLTTFLQSCSSGNNNSNLSQSGTVFYFDEGKTYILTPIGAMNFCVYVSII